MLDLSEQTVALLWHVCHGQCVCASRCHGYGHDEEEQEEEENEDKKEEDRRSHEKGGVQSLTIFLCC